MSVPRLSIRGLKKAFGPKVVLDGVDLDVAVGESLVIIGGSGTGKSVLLKCILGLIHPDSGSIKLDGQELVGLKGKALEQARARFGMLFQGGALFDSLPVWRNVTFALTQGKLGAGAAMHKIAVENLAKVGLEPRVADLRPSELSGGMQKRVALARAIAANPEILFFDEPTTGLDPIRADTINALIRQQVSAMGATALTITHDMASARHIADRIAMLHGGRILWDGPVSQLDSSGNAFVDQFVHGRSEGPITAGANG
ncbi:ATP-binding cassette domain-containing protein [Sandaracinobacter neustonicus]|uniref:ATP-binding cassette domain-containing protein n=1 Tax=Sandaracinobacter neustonicus TaxID=1715348 RepID=A0A501XVY2_9SPHN|nr:ATP-binding cassette domain-containing protein [Sandaracinobacter neustonicus]TPE64619.1 ATP-binding cassette domain-containing protein [Sandaracinobacter neustonicus]